MKGTWSSAEIAGNPADVYDPPGQPRFGLLFLHDYDRLTLRDQPVFTKLFDELHLACVCPAGGRCWWADRVCPEFDAQVTPERYLLQSVLPFFRERWGLGPRTVGLLGIGMGGQGALRLAFKHPETFPAVAALAPMIEYHELYGRGEPLDEMYDSKEQCRQDTAPMHVHPSRFPPHVFFAIDPREAFWFRGNDRLHEKLNALGVPHEIDFAPGPGVAERAIRFLYAGLEQESRRLL
jgi:pimeloyl-ACP methyl ester carboxylesterase